MTQYSIPSFFRPLLIGSLLISSPSVFSATPATTPTALTAELDAIISKTTAGLSEGEQKMIADWSPAKKLSEFFCQKLALTELGKTYTGADRVFLSRSDDQPPEFISKNAIKGQGSVRYGADWADFSYECAVNMETGAAESFTFK